MKRKHAPLRAHRLADLTSRLRRQARKVTAPRQAILEILRQQPRPLSNKEIFAALPRGAGDLATVYRCLHLLERLGMVKRCDFGDGVARFELLGEGDNGHHHHLICRRCAVVVELDECFGAEVERSLAAASGFTQITHTLEFFGVCPQCQER